MGKFTKSSHLKDSREIIKVINLSKSYKSKKVLEKLENTVELKKITVEKKIEKLIEELNPNFTASAKEISLKTNKELMDIYIKSLIKTMGGENLNGMKIILDTC